MENLFNGFFTRKQKEVCLEGVTCRSVIKIGSKISVCPIFENSHKIFIKSYPLINLILQALLCIHVSCTQPCTHIPSYIRVFLFLL